MRFDGRVVWRAVIYAVRVTAQRSGGNEMPLFLGSFASVPITLAKWFGEVAEREGEAAAAAAAGQSASE
jgi:hypothetical protein